MNLPVPGVSETDGPQWATDLNSCLTLIDSHTHASGSGVQITPDGLNINADLPFNNNNLTLIKSARFMVQSVPLGGASDLGCLYVSGVDLYYNDENGNQIQITSGGGVAGSPGSIANLTSPASASYVSANGTFVWQQAANTSADMDFGSAIMRNDTANSFALTLSPPTAMGANFSLTLPNLPASQKFMTLDSSGNMSAPWAVDNSTLEIASSTTLQVKDGGITKPKLAALGQQVSSSSGSFTTNSTSFVNVTNLSVTLTTTGRPVWIGLQGNGSTSPTPSIFLQRNGTSNGMAGDVAFVRDGSGFANSRMQIQYPSNANLNTYYLPPSSFWVMDTGASAGSHTYTIQVRCVILTNVIDAMGVTETQLVAYEL